MKYIYRVFLVLVMAAMSLSSCTENDAMEEIFVAEPMGTDDDEKPLNPPPPPPKIG